MPVIITLKDIEEAIDNLNYRSETTLKSKLIRAIRNFYPDESSIEALESIDTEELVKSIWETGDDQELLKTKRKNFSSIKSSVNSDLKKLYSEGKNPQGIIIGHNNIFDISAEAKNKALSNIADIFREKGIDTQSKITEILNALSDISADAISSPDAAEAREEIDRLRNLVSSLSAKAGLPTLEEEGRDKTSTGAGIEEKKGDGAGIGKIAEDAGEIKGKALSDIAGILKDKGIDAGDKMNKIREALQGILSDAISLAGPDLNSQEAAQIKTLFGDLSGTIQEALGRESSAGQTDNLPGIENVLTEQSPDAQDKVSNIMSAVNEMLADALVSGAEGLGSEKTERIKNLFDTLADKVKSALSSGYGLDNIGFVDKEIAGTDTGDIAQAALEGSATEIVEEIVEEDAEAEITGQMEEAGLEEAVEVIEESGAAQLSAETEGIVEEIEISGEEEYISDTGMEEIPPDQDADAATISEELTADEVVEIVEEVYSDELAETATDGEISGEAVAPESAAVDFAVEDDGLTGPVIAPEEQPGQMDDATPDKPDYEEIIEVDDSIAQPLATLEEETVAGEFPAEEVIADDTIIEAAETLPDDYAIAETTVEGEQEELAEVDIVEEAAGEEFEEIITDEAADEEELSAPQDKTAGEAVTGDLRTRAEILAELAAAAKALEKIGPDLSSSIYSEEEIKEKAKLLSEEFDRYLSVREKFYNQHILIKGGNYPVGTADRGKNEFPEQVVNLREFYIGKFPVTNALFEIFVEKTGYITTAERYGFGMVYIPRMQKKKNALTGSESFVWNSQLQHKRVPGACWYRPCGPESTLYVKRTHPVVQVSLDDACAFAAWTGKRIPAEKEWEAAARTSRSYLYPWGNTWRDDACNLEKSLLGDTAPVDQYIKFANEYEVADTLGNVLEWTLDPWEIIEQGIEGEETYVVKGASWISDSEVRLTDRQPVYKDASSNILGFRCIAI
ncbi:MAG: SUMF1/EgtB/PvdO family nonheme iron enzyme [Smithellaceae bacterium]